MSLASFLVVLSFIWIAIHGARYYLKQRSAPSLLPSLSNDALGSRRRRLWGNSVTVTLKLLHLRVETTGGNAFHDRFAAWLGKRRGRGLARVLRAFYDVGTVLGGVGMLGAVGLLLWMLVGEVRSLSVGSAAGYGEGIKQEAVRLAKRAVDSAVGATGSVYQESSASRVGSVIIPIIPGVTVPFSHLPAIIGAVFWSQVVHELGHATAAALDSIPVISAGASVTVCVPAAFVGFSTAKLHDLMPRDRARIVAAGPFHNLLFWIVLALAGYFGAGNAVGNMAGYSNVGDVGKVVVDVEATSPLFGHLKPGSLVVKLDDTSLGATNSSQDVWTSYLTTPERAPAGLGWCVDRDSLERSQTCCSRIDATPVSGHACFTAIEDALEQGCINPLPILTQLDWKRCSGTADCPANESCVRPNEKQHILRLTVQSPSAAEQKDTIVLWSGPREEIWEEVVVGKWLPRTRFLPIWLPVSLEILFGYLKMATLSLYFLNLLPLPHLDGDKFLGSMLDVVFGAHDMSAEAYDIEALEAQERRNKERRPRRWKDMLVKYVPQTGVCLVVSCILLALVNLRHVS